MGDLRYAIEPAMRWFPGKWRPLWRRRVGDGSQTGGPVYAECDDNLARIGRATLVPPQIAYVWSEDDDWTESNRGTVVEAAMHVGPVYLSGVEDPRRVRQARQRRHRQLEQRLRAESDPAKRAILENDLLQEQERPLLYRVRPVVSADSKLIQNGKHVVESFVSIDGTKTIWESVLLDRDSYNTAGDWVYRRYSGWCVTDRNQRWPACARQLVYELEVEGRQKIDVLAQLVADGELIVGFASGMALIGSEGIERERTRRVAIIFGSTECVHYYINAVKLSAKSANPDDMGLFVSGSNSSFVE